MKILNAVIQLRRDNETNFEKIKDTFIPLNGEVVLVDTSNGLRAKIGTGTTKYANLPFTDVIARNGVTNGYLDNGIFYTDISKSQIIEGSIGKLYIDNSHSTVYYYDGDQYIGIQGTLTLASAEKPGIVKLYNTLGYNVDGTMTQKAITDEFNTRYKTSIDSQKELLVFSL